MKQAINFTDSRLISEGGGWLVYADFRSYLQIDSNSFRSKIAVLLLTLEDF